LSLAASGAEKSAPLKGAAKSQGQKIFAGLIIGIFKKMDTH
jgi:hypothetical protein